jgi:hypothetical protein
MTHNKGDDGQCWPVSDWTDNELLVLDPTDPAFALPPAKVTWRRPGAILATRRCSRSSRTIQGAGFHSVSSPVLVGRSSFFEVGPPASRSPPINQEPRHAFQAIPQAMASAGQGGLHPACAARTDHERVPSPEGDRPEGQGSQGRRGGRQGGKGSRRGAPWPADRPLEPGIVSPFCPTPSPAEPFKAASLKPSAQQEAQAMTSSTAFAYGWPQNRSELINSITTRKVSQICPIDPCFRVGFLSPKTKNPWFLPGVSCGAGDETRTHDLQHGKLSL